MVPIALILLAIVILFSVAVVVSNPVAVDLSIFGAHIPVSTPAVYFTGAGAMLVVLVALFLLRTGARRSMARRKEVRTLKKEVKAQNATGASTQNASGATAQSAGGRSACRHRRRDIAGTPGRRLVVQTAARSTTAAGTDGSSAGCRVIPCWVVGRWRHRSGRHLVARVIRRVAAHPELASLACRLEPAELASLAATAPLRYRTSSARAQVPPPPRNVRPGSPRSTTSPGTTRSGELPRDLPARAAAPARGAQPPAAHRPPSASLRTTAGNRSRPRHRRDPATAIRVMSTPTEAAEPEPCRAELRRVGSALATGNPPPMPP